MFRIKFWVLIALIFFSACSKKEEFVTASGSIMGTYYVVKVKADIDKMALEQKVHTRLEELNKIFSTYDPESELSKINSSDQLQHKVSDELATVLKKALEISDLSGGSFDITMGPLVNVWGFGPTGQLKRRPDKKVIQELLANTGHKNLELSNNLLTLKKKQYIDLSAIAKGYAVDRIVDYLKELGMTTVLVEIGGEVRTLGKKSEKEPWIIGIEQPVESRSPVQRLVPLTNLAIATSGSYRNYRQYGDSIFGHTIDPKTGEPVTHKLISVSVIATTCMEADALATAFMVLGPEKGLELADEEGLLVYFMVKDGEKIFTKSSTGFKEYLSKVEKEE